MNLTTYLDTSGWQSALHNAHRRQLLSCGAITPFPRDQVFGDVYVDDLAVLAMVETPNRAFAEDQLRMDRADAMHAALGMPIKKPGGDGDFAWPLLGAHLNGQRGTLRFPMCRRATLAASELVWLSAVKEAPRRLGVHPFVSTGVPLLPRLQLRWRRKPPQPQALQTLLDVLVLVSVLAPLYSVNLRSPPLNQLFAFDASDSRAGECRALVSEERTMAVRMLLLSEERGEHVRLDWGCQPPEPVFADTRAAAAWGALSLPWKPFFSFAFKAQQHINLLEIESCLSLLRHLAAERRQNCRVLAMTDRRVALGALSKGRSSSRTVNYLKKVAALCLCYGFPVRCCVGPNVGQPCRRERPLTAWRNALLELPPVPPARLLSQQGENELRQLTEPFPAVPVVSQHHGSPLAPSPPACSPAAASAVPAAFAIWPEARYVLSALRSRLPNVGSPTWAPGLLAELSRFRRWSGTSSGRLRRASTRHRAGARPRTRGTSCSYARRASANGLPFQADAYRVKLQLCTPRRREWFCASRQCQRCHPCSQPRLVCIEPTPVAGLPGSVVP